MFELSWWIRYKGLLALLWCQNKIAWNISVTKPITCPLLKHKQISNAAQSVSLSPFVSVYKFQRKLFDSIVINTLFIVLYKEKYVRNINKTIKYKKMACSLRYISLFCMLVIKFQFSLLFMWCNFCWMHVAYTTLRLKANNDFKRQLEGKMIVCPQISWTTISMFS